MFIYFLLRDQDNAIIRPLPKIKRMISDNACLPHIVQVPAQSELRYDVSYPLWRIAQFNKITLFFYVLSSYC